MLLTEQCCYMYNMNNKMREEKKKKYQRICEYQQLNVLAKLTE